MHDIMKVINSDTATVRVHLIKKGGNPQDYSCVVFPNDLNELIKKAYKDNFNLFIKDKTVTDYDSIHTEKGSIQKATLADISEWINIKNAIKKADDDNVIMNKSNFSDNYHVIVVTFEAMVEGDIKCAYLVAQYRKIESWYKKSVKFGFTTDGLQEKNSDIFLLNGCIDTVVYEDYAFILQENQFEKLFKYYKKSINTLEKNRDNIENCSFIDKPSEFYESVRSCKGATKKMARVMSKQAIDLQTLPSKTVKEQLIKYEEFSSIEFDAEDKIVLNTKTRDMIIDILRCVYTRSLFTENVVHTKGV